jgi:hypothetical protein
MFTVQYVKDMQWINAEHTMFTCIVKYEEFDEEHPSGINAIDPYPHIQEIWIKANAGEYGSIADYVPPPPPVAKPAEEQPVSEGTQTIETDTAPTEGTQTL